MKLCCRMTVKILLEPWLKKLRIIVRMGIGSEFYEIPLNGGIQTYGENYWDTYAPVVNLVSIRVLLTISKLLNIHTRSIEFTLAFSQADADVTIYMELSVGFE